MAIDNLQRSFVCNGDVVVAYTHDFTISSVGLIDGGELPTVPSMPSEPKVTEPGPERSRDALVSLVRCEIWD